MIDHDSPPHLLIRSVSKSFGKSSKSKLALNDVSLSVQPGERVALLGASGSGKSTLLRVINGLHVADRTGEGLVQIDGRPLQQGGRLSADVRDIRSNIATIFQQFNLVLRLKVLTNVCVGSLHAMPFWRALLGFFPRQTLLRALDALDRVGILEQAYKRARLLSGGQQQRVAIARAMTQGARLILADEPIASLDPESSRRVMELLVLLNQEQGATVLVSLHQVAVALKYCQRVVALRDGRVVYDGPSASLSVDQLKSLYGSESDLIFDELEAPKSLPQKPPTPQPPSARSSHEVYAS